MTGAQHLAAVMQRPLHPAPPATRCCGDCPSVLRPRSGPRPTDARCAEAPGAPMLGHGWQPRDAAPFWCPRQRNG